MRAGDPDPSGESIVDDEERAAMVSPEHEDERRRTDRGGSPTEGDGTSGSGSGGFRRAVERRSAVPLVWLRQRPRWAVPLIFGALFIAGLTAPGVIGALCLTLVAVFFLWLAFLTWPTLDRARKAPRVLMVAVVLLLAVARALGY
ncbi:DUF6703 family protein [Nocardiopsis alba]|uniref:Uncharacterized protein n=2 Tax=Nocardiopsis alba TaxID=53437 RepID=J7LJ72_NOCAA|nr:hypothetical protein B005_3642 [Nocardiopsis alba ATCC BAA-2165]